MLELAGILVFGIFAQWLAWRVKIPAILPLIVLGISIGPLWSYFHPDHTKLINIDTIFQGHYLFDFVSLCVGIILFEGGLTLKLKEVKKVASVVRNIIFIGSIVTLFGTTWAVSYFMELDIKIAFLFGALVIVTGPTVIKPILNNVRPTANVATVLKWEGVLIDPVGAFAAVLIYDFIIAGGGDFTFFALKGFSLIVLSGAFVGVAIAMAMKFMLNRELIPHYLINVVVLAFVVLCFAISDQLHAESGLLAVTILGMIITNSKVKGLKEILSFKEDITILLISILFIALSSRINISDIQLLGHESIIVFCILIFVIRPVGVFISSIKSELNFKEKLFISWISPRGIVSAGVASIFTLHLTTLPDINLSEKAIQDASLLLPMTFMVIVGTVIIQGSTAKLLARKLGLIQTQSLGFVIIGANDFALEMAKYLYKKGIEVLISDTSNVNITKAKQMGLPVFEGNAVLENSFEEEEFTKYGTLLSLTPSTEINHLACKNFSKYFGIKNVFRLASKREFEEPTGKYDERILFEAQGDYIELTNLIRKGNRIKSKEFVNNQFYENYVKDFNIIPLMREYNLNEYVPINTQKAAQSKPFKLVYIEK